MKVGDLVRLQSSNTVGVVIKVAPQVQDDLNDLFPYLIHFFDGMPTDFFGARHLEVISESR